MRSGRSETLKNQDVLSFKELKVNVWMLPEHHFDVFSGHLNWEHETFYKKKGEKYHVHA